MRAKFLIIIALFSVFSLVSCAKKAVRAPLIAKTKVILLAEEDGKVGQITVTTAKGAAVIDKSNYAVELYAADKPPSDIKAVDPAAVQKEFGDALEAQPDPPATFLLYFITGKTVLTKESQEKINDILADIKNRTAPRINIVGHTDRAGREQYNYELALNRAEIVKEWMLNFGINPDDIFEVISHGESNPVIKTEDGVSEPKNRRVEVIVR